MKKFKSIVYIASFTGFLAITAVLLSFTSEGAVTPYANDGGGGQWKNLKVLPQDISRDSLMGLMKGYNMALGVKCSYCHVVKGKDLNAASDDKKEKEYARKMITMTRKINAEHFNWANSPEPEKIDHVKCVMCHQGHASPTEHMKNIGYFYGADNE